MKGADEPIGCVACGGTFTARQLVQGTRELESKASVFNAEVPCCRSRDTFDLGPEEVWRGYLAGTGSAHFIPMEKYAAPGLVGEVVGEQFVLTWGDWRHAVPIR